jgi:hypothetical protein
MVYPVSIQQRRPFQSNRAQQHLSPRRRLLLLLLLLRPLLQPLLLLLVRLLLLLPSLRGMLPVVLPQSPRQIMQGRWCKASNRSRRSSKYPRNPSSSSRWGWSSHHPLQLLLRLLLLLACQQAQTALQGLW